MQTAEPLVSLKEDLLVLRERALLDLCIRFFLVACGRIRVSFVGEARHVAQRLCTLDGLVTFYFFISPSTGL